jgi:hypothetical protein
MEKNGLLVLKGRLPVEEMPSLYALEEMPSLYALVY